MSLRIPTYLNICTYHITDGEEELHDSISEVRGLNPPEELEYKDMFTTPEVQDFTMTYANGKPELPDSPVDKSVFYVSVDDDEDLHIHSHTESHLYEDIVKFHSNVGECLGDMMVHRIGLYYRFEEQDPFGDNIKTYLNDEAKVTGMRAESGDLTISFSIEEDIFRASFRTHSNEAVEEASIEDMVEERVKYASGKLDDLLS